MVTRNAETVEDMLSQLVEEILEHVAIEEPPVDAVKVACRMGMVVRLNRVQSARGRIVKTNGLVTITVRPEQRKERFQWSVAHQIGDDLIPRMIDRWPEEMALDDGASREWLANRFAMHLLAPTDWYERDVERLGGDLVSLKLLYRTASYEVLAMRILDVCPGLLMTIFDNGRQTRRISNLPYRPPHLSPAERDCWTRCRKSGRFARSEDPSACVRAGPIHEDGWKREILITEVGVSG